MRESLLEAMGWRQFALYLEEMPCESEVARVTGMQRGHYLLASDRGWLDGVPAGRLQHRAHQAEQPAVGDWVRIGSDFANDRGEAGAMVRQVLPRRTRLARLQSGNIAEEQVLAANVDRAFIVTSANAEMKTRRLQRYLLIARQGGIEPVIILSKIELTSPELAIAELQKKFPDVAILGVSGLTGTGMPRVRELLEPGRTAVFVGSSGVGKSTMVNALLGEAVQETFAIREKDGRGRHTTTSREMFLLPGGGLVIDTPGLRELQVFGDEEQIASPFSIIETLAAGCAFRDCRHATEPGCAISAAVASGQLDASIHEDYLKLQNESTSTNDKMTRRQRAKIKRAGKAFRGKKESSRARTDFDE